MRKRFVVGSQQLSASVPRRSVNERWSLHLRMVANVLEGSGDGMRSFALDGWEAVPQPPPVRTGEEVEDLRHMLVSIF